VGVRGEMTKGDGGILGDRHPRLPTRLLDHASVLQKTQYLLPAARCFDERSGEQLPSEGDGTARREQIQ
jgi:hypothetical protein